VAVYEAGQFRDPRTLSYMTSLTPPMAQFEEDWFGFVRQKYGL
jgi:hypothetical protein